jgi:hypothetical protein
MTHLLPATEYLTLRGNKKKENTLGRMVFSPPKYVFFVIFLVCY